MPYFATLEYGYSETYTDGGTYIIHSNYSYARDWTGHEYADIEVLHPTSVKYYDSSGTYIKSVSMPIYDYSITDPNLIQYSAWHGTDIATVNTSSSTAKQLLEYSAATVFGHIMKQLHLKFQNSEKGLL